MAIDCLFGKRAPNFSKNLLPRKKFLFCCVSLLLCQNDQKCTNGEKCLNFSLGYLLMCPKCTICLMTDIVTLHIFSEIHNIFVQIAKFDWVCSNVVVLVAVDVAAKGEEYGAKDNVCVLVWCHGSQISWEEC